ncbi:LytTR family DNA-binding domain-containing protein [Streptococcus saliviloxodontae]|uniref:DNA-binding LytR/AlgR family response regulator n=1 Tax=Streptococcus saliviloxodontae TaxID=1349416 RepID=A0ABS2PIF5_9STRE|nr:LytTR family DNA-binding domain-containing protein [Streptococcus saliviloxodontae]MBM7635224.1 DNA-binding LytR/AlgR family response regulator [Streptococcus saliviloxodontae]
MKWQFIEDQSSLELDILLKKQSQDEEVLKLIGLLEQFNGQKQHLIAVKVEDGIQFVALDDLIAVDVEAGHLILTSRKGTFVTRERLYQFKEKYLSDHFVQVSKQTIINVTYLERMEASFSGNMTAFLTDGYQTSVSRRYLKLLEKTLGI